MRPAPFAFASTTSVDETIKTLAEHPGARIIAGGLSLVPMLNFRQLRPSYLVDINGVRELDYIRLQDGSLRIGAMTRQRDVERSDLVRDHCPLLHQAIRLVGFTQIRNRGTIGGSLAQAEPAGEIPAVAIAASARLRLRGPAGERDLAADDFFRGGMTTAIAADELLLAVEFPSWSGSVGTAFREFSRGPRGYAIVGVAAMLSLDDAGAVLRCGLSLAGVGDRPLNAASVAADLLQGKAPDAALLIQVASAVAAAVEPVANLHAPPAYQRQLVRVLTLQALSDALEQARTTRKGT